MFCYGKRDNCWRGKLSDYGAANFMRQSMTKMPGARIYAAPEALTSQQSPKVRGISVLPSHSVAILLGGRGVHVVVAKIAATPRLAFVFATHRRNPTAVRHRCAQRCDSENEHSAVTAKASTAL